MAPSTSSADRSPSSEDRVPAALRSAGRRKTDRMEPGWILDDVPESRTGDDLIEDAELVEDEVVDGHVEVGSQAESGAGADPTHSVPLAEGFLDRPPATTTRPATPPRVRVARALGISPRLVGGPKPVGGVAPFIEPRSRLSRWSKARELVNRGYVPLSPGRPKLRHRILPRSVIGIVTMLMMLGVGAAFSGAAFYAYYDARLADNERAVARFVEGFDQQFSDATGAIDQLRSETITEIRDELKPLGEYVADANGVIQLPEVAGPSVWMVETRDQDGRLTAGAAFAVVPHDGGGTAMVTSYSLIAASTIEPAPGIDLIKDSERLPARLWAWDIERDLAVLVVDREIPVLEFATEQGQLESVGSRLFALSGMGGGGSTASPGVLLDRSQIGLQHTAPVGTLFVGGPLLNGEGKVLGVASTNYRPLGIDPGDVAQAPDVRSMCAVILECSQVRERVVIDVSADDSEAPETDGSPVRGGSPDVTEESAEPESGDEVDDEAVDEGAPAEEASDGGTDE